MLVPFARATFFDRADLQNTTDPPAKPPGAQSPRLFHRTWTHHTVQPLLRAQGLAFQIRWYRILAFHLRRDLALLSRAEAQP